MPITESIRQRGFRRWYERELLRGHAHLVLVLLCAVAVMGAVEAFGQLHGQQRLLMVACLLVATALGILALRRYLHHLGQAEALAHQAVCPHCRTYARWQVDEPATPAAAAAAAAGPTPPAGDGGVLPVRCQSCGGRWSIHG